MPFPSSTPFASSLEQAVLAGSAAVLRVRASFARSDPAVVCPRCLVEALDPQLLRVIVGPRLEEAWVSPLVAHYQQLQTRYWADWLDIQAAWREKRKRWWPAALALMAAEKAAAGVPAPAPGRSVSEAGDAGTGHAAPSAGRPLRRVPSPEPGPDSAPALRVARLVPHGTAPALHDGEDPVAAPSPVSRVGPVAPRADEDADEAAAAAGDTPGREARALLPAATAVLSAVGVDAPPSPPASSAPPGGALDAKGKLPRVPRRLREALRQGDPAPLAREPGIRPVAAGAAAARDATPAGGAAGSALAGALRIGVHPDVLPRFLANLHVALDHVALSHHEFELTETPILWRERGMQADLCGIAQAGPFLAVYPRPAGACDDRSIVRVESPAR